MYHTGKCTQVNVSTCMWFVSELNDCKHTNFQTCDHTQKCTCGNMHISTVWCLLEVTYLSTHAYVPACAHSQNFVYMLKCAYAPTYYHAWNFHVCQHAHMCQCEQDQNFHRYQNAHTWWCVSMLRVACMVTHLQDMCLLKLHTCKHIYVLTCDDSLRSTCQYTYMNQHMFALDTWHLCKNVHIVICYHTWTHIKIHTWKGSGFNPQRHTSMHISYIQAHTWKVKRIYDMGLKKNNTHVLTWRICQGRKWKEKYNVFKYGFWFCLSCQRLSQGFHAS